MIFRKWNIVYPSKKAYNDFKNIEDNIKPFYNKLPNCFNYKYTPSFIEISILLIK